MKRTGILATALIAIFLLFTLQIIGSGWENAGLTVVSELVDNGRTITSLTDANGKAFTVITMTEPTQDQINMILLLKDQFYGWKAATVTVKSMTFIVLDQKIECDIIPTSVLYQGVDLAQFLPAGIVITYDVVLTVNVKVKKDNNLVSVTGKYANEKDLFDAILAASNSPADYAKTTTVDYLKDKLAEQTLIATTTMASAKSLSEKGYLTLSGDMRNRIANILKTYPSAKATDIVNSLAKDKIVISVEEADFLLYIYKYQKK